MDHRPTVSNSVHVSSVVVLGAEAKQCASSPAGHAARASASVSYSPEHVAISTGQSGGETGGGEKLRVRSNNLRVVRPAAASSGKLERDGGYAEEFVYVQPH